MGSAEVYTANAYHYSAGGKKVFFTKANPVHIELLEKVGGMITFTLADKDMDGFLFEKDTGFLVCDVNGSKDYSSYDLPDHYSINI